MSFRVRVLSLMTLVTLLATGATAWLTLRTANRQVEQTVAAGRQDVQLITDEVARFGRANDTWDGVDRIVAELAARTGQRVRLVTESGREVADSDVLAGGRARPVTGLPTVADPRPRLMLPTVVEPAGEASTHPLGALKFTASAVWEYQAGQQIRRCLVAAGLGVSTTSGPNGIDTVAPTRWSEQAERCKREADNTNFDFGRMQAELDPCAALWDAAMRDCFRSGFLRLISPLAPEPLSVHVGALDEPRGAALPIAPVAGAAGAVALLAVMGSLLLSRHVLRPVRALTGAAKRLGRGDLTDRVPVTGQDEIAMLSRAFNRMAQQLHDSEARQRRMMADIAHELRSPLTNLRGYLEALTDGTAEPTRELLLSLREETLLQQRIIDDLQDLTLAEAGRLTYRRGPVDLAELARGYAPQHEVRTPTGPAYVDGDPDRLRQVVNNLVRNAVTAGGPVTIAVAPNGEHVTLSVSDRGAGIAAEHLPHIFERFWRMDPARRSGSGAGLGLAIARQIVTDHGGTIEADSVPGAGTTFTISVPADPNAASPPDKAKGWQRIR